MSVLMFLLLLSICAIWPQICKIKFQATLCKILPLIRYNTIDYFQIKFYLEQIYMRPDMKSNAFEFS